MFRSSCLPVSSVSHADSQTARGSVGVCPASTGASNHWEKEDFIYYIIYILIMKACKHFLVSIQNKGTNLKISTVWDL